LISLATPPHYAALRHYVAAFTLLPYMLCCCYDDAYAMRHYIFAACHADAATAADIYALQLLLCFFSCFFDDIADDI